MSSYEIHHHPIPKSYDLLESTRVKETTKLDEVIIFANDFSSMDIIYLAFPARQNTKVRNYFGAL